MKGFSGFEVLTIEEFNKSICALRNLKPQDSV